MSRALPEEIELFFDPSCPWTWATSRWLVDAAAQRGIDVRYRSLSLAVLNAGREMPERSRAGMRAATAAHRLFAALRADGRNDVIGAVYTEFGRRRFHDQAEPSSTLVAEAAAHAGAGDRVTTLEDTAWDGEVEASTREAVELAGPDVGSPVLAFDQPRVALFGPVVSPPPQGPAAADLLEVVVEAARTPGFFELKRGRNTPPAFGPRP